MIKPRKIPMRMCVGCREMKPKKELLRVVRTPEGSILVDLTGKKSGRGAYICPASACLGRARKQRQLERVLECPIDAAAYEALEQSVREAEGCAGQ